jgi:predicted nucleic acid-binding protein
MASACPLPSHCSKGSWPRRTLCRPALHQTRSVPFFDAIVLASAHALGCNVLWTEDMNVGEVVNGVRVADPFAGDLVA